MSVTYPDLTLTNFPENIDQFISWLDIVSTDGVLVKQYQDALKQGNMVLARQTLEQIPEYKRKILTANSLNQITQAMLALERFYITDIGPYVENLQQTWEDTVEAFSYKGVWANNIVYEKNNLVSYVSAGFNLIYLAIENPPKGTTPDNLQYWRVLTVRGIRGNSGAGFSYCFEWQAGTTYTDHDAVTHNGGLWLAQKTSTNIEPGTDNSYWKQTTSTILTTYPITEIEPTNQKAGDLWFNTQNSPTSYKYLTPLQNPASADDIIKGKEAYDVNGNVIVGTYAPPQFSP